jgi:hypothetical protein
MSGTSWWATRRPGVLSVCVLVASFSADTGALIATFRCAATARRGALADEGRCGDGGAGQDPGGETRVIGSVTRFGVRARRSIRFAGLEL